MKKLVSDKSLELGQREAAPSLVADARMIVGLHKNREYLGFLRMVMSDARQFPWIAQQFAAVMDPQTERLTRYLAHLTDLGILNCQNPTLAAHQFTGILYEFFLWPWMIGRDRALASDEDVVEEALRMFLLRYRPARQQMVPGRRTGARRRSRKPAGHR